MERRITLGATALIILTAAFWVFWLWSFGSWAVPTVLDPDRWLALRPVETHGTVGMGQRMVLGAMVITVILAGSLNFAAALWLLILIRRGEYFTFRSTRAISILGWAFIFMTVWDTIYAAILTPVLTWNNTNTAGTLADGTVSPAIPYIGPSYYYDPGDISLALCGLGFALMGYVLTVARALEDEAKAYV